MSKAFSKITFATLALAGVFCASQTALAQVAGGTTTVGISVIESTQIAAGWSVKKTLMGKTIYNDADQKVGKVEDLIISPDKKLSYVIVGAGGFLGMGRNDVAVPVTQIEDKGGKLVMAGATKEMVKSMPQFTYATQTPDTSKRDAFVAAADKDIAKGKAKVTELEKKAGAAATDAKAKMNQEITLLQGDLKTAEAKLDEMKKATAARWKEFEADVSAATARLRKSTDTVTG
jgi:sporulation protein YlmC with PRC-barrel domain